MNDTYYNELPSQPIVHSASIPKTEDVSSLIENALEPRVWKDHMVKDLMKFWDTPQASSLQGGLLKTYLTNDGSYLPEDSGQWPEEFRQAAASADTKGLIDPEYNYVRSHSRQTYAYGVAGDAGVCYDAMDAQMACDLAEMARPVTKYAVRVTHPSSLLRLWRRAYKMALTPPMGPVFLCLPMDIMDAENEEEVRASVNVDVKTSPSSEQIDRIAEGLAGAKHPVALVGDGVDACGAKEELERFAELLAIPVYAVNSSCINISQGSPYYRGDLGHMFGADSRKAVQDADVVLIAGTYVFPEVFPDIGNPFRADARIYHIDTDAYEIAKNHPVMIGICADIRKTLQILNGKLCSMAIPGREQRMRELGGSADIPQDDGSAAAAFMEQMRELIDEDTIIFDEALTASHYITSSLPRTKTGTYFQTRGGSLGVGIPGAMGIQLACPNANVIAFTGDGGSMYTIQALYTAARYGIPLKAVICRNGRYGLLDENIKVYWKENNIVPHNFPECFSLEPRIDFVRLAHSMGVNGIRADTRDEAKAAARMLLESSAPFLVDLNTGK